MLVYRATKAMVRTSWLMEGVRCELRALEGGGFADHDRAQALLMEAGALEAAAVDALCPLEDAVSPKERALREVTLEAGRLLSWSWEGCPGECQRSAGRLGAALDRLEAFSLPPRLEAGVPEGFAWYALYPEAYLVAAGRFQREQRPRGVVCLGIRGIGAALSAAVAAVLERRGCKVWSFTVRPRGHPFDRRLRLAPQLKARLRSLAQSPFLLVDEGPGLSGSSLCGAARALADLGVPDRRIVLFPSWVPDGSGFRSDMARERWPRHGKVAAGFEEVWGTEGLADLSAGGWRALNYRGEEDWPAAHPHHERRKYGGVGRGGPFLARFAGLGRYGRAALTRAEALAEAGFGPPVLGLANGFLVQAFLPGRPATGDDAGRLLERAAPYLAFLRHRFPAEGGASLAELAELIRYNTREGLGDVWADRLSGLERLQAEAEGAPTVAIDGRMMPHEWRVTDAGLFKTDGLDHHCDHFYPGAQDIAWDVAGACVELIKGKPSRHLFLERYRRLSGDWGVARRLPFHTLAYLACRLGYASLAAQELGPSAEGGRFRRLASWYGDRLREAIGELLP